MLEPGSPLFPKHEVDSFFSMKHELEKYSELKAVFSNMVEAVLVVDEVGKLTNLNHAAARLLNIQASRAIGEHFADVIRNPDMHRFLGRILNSQAPVETEIVFLSSDNEQFYLQGHGVLIRDKNLKKSRALAVFNDVTKLRRLESIRSDFVANVSHELKTLVQRGDCLHAVEVKSAATAASDFFRGFEQIAGRIQTAGLSLRLDNVVVYGGETSQQRSTARLLGWRDVGKILHQAL